MCQSFFSGKEDTVNCYITDATGFSFGDKYNLNWQRGTQVRTVKSHVRLEVVIAVDNKGRRIITGCETGGPYASEIEMLRKILNRIERLKKVPFIADKGYDAVDIIQKVFDIGFVPAVKVKETFRMKVKHPLRKISKENYEKYGKERYKIESLFGTIKQKLGSGLRVIREDIAKKMALI